MGRIQPWELRMADSKMIVFQTIYPKFYSKVLAFISSIELSLASSISFG